MENMVTANFWRERRIFVTGHTGFKGGWLAIWLKMLGAKVYGYSLPPPTTPALFDVANVATGLNSAIGDIRDALSLGKALEMAQPEIIFHLAAQPLVGEGYRDPLRTYGTNVMGTANLLEASRTLSCLRCIVVVTTDKCYTNNETGQPFRESDPLGGHDPYSSSKACTELVCDAYRQSFLVEKDIRLGTARAGNVIGGGDWAANRLVPDLLRDYAAGRPARLRNPHSVRPWQHVLEPLAGYLVLAEALSKSAAFSRAWNFGPEPESCQTTGAVADLIAASWGENAHWVSEKADFPHEAKLLHLDVEAAKKELKWRPIWPLTEAIRQTVAWHRSWLAGADMNSICQAQIEQYSKEQQ